MDQDDIMKVIRQIAFDIQQSKYKKIATAHYSAMETSIRSEKLV